MDAFKIGSLIIAGISAVCSIVKIINDNKSKKELIEELKHMNEDDRKEIRNIAISKYLDNHPEMIKEFINNTHNE